MVHLGAGALAHAIHLVDVDVEGAEVLKHLLQGCTREHDVTVIDVLGQWARQPWPCVGSGQDRDWL